MGPRVKQLVHQCHGGSRLFLSLTCYLTVTVWLLLLQPKLMPLPNGFPKRNDGVIKKSSVCEVKRQKEFLLKTLKMGKRHSQKTQQILICHWPEWGHLSTPKPVMARQNGCSHQSGFPAGWAHGSGRKPHLPLSLCSQSSLHWRLPLRGHSWVPPSD